MHLIKAIPIIYQHNKSKLFEIMSKIELILEKFPETHHVILRMIRDLAVMEDHVDILIYKKEIILISEIFKNA